MAETDKSKNAGKGSGTAISDDVSRGTEHTETGAGPGDQGGPIEASVETEKGPGSDEQVSDSDIATSGFVAPVEEYVHQAPKTPAHEVLRNQAARITDSKLGRLSDREKNELLNNLASHCIIRREDLIPEKDRVELVRQVIFASSAIDIEVCEEITSFAVTQIGLPAVKDFGAELGMSYEYCHKHDCPGHLIDNEYVGQFRDAAIANSERSRRRGPFGGMIEIIPINESGNMGSGIRLPEGIEDMLGSLFGGVPGCHHHRGR